MGCEMSSTPCRQARSDSFCISSTGVYGDAEGQWVDEDWPCRPMSDAGRALLAAEEVLHRSAGPAGHHPSPGRALWAGTIAEHSGQSHLDVGRPAIGRCRRSMVNLIHVDDAAAVVLAAERPRPAAADLPRFRRPSDRPPHVSFLLWRNARACRRRDSTIRPRRHGPRRGGDKRVRNTRMLAELGVELAYPSYREGLAAAVGASDSGPL